MSGNAFSNFEFLSDDEEPVKEKTYKAVMFSPIMPNLVMLNR